MDSNKWRMHNASGNKRVIVTKELPGDRWLNFLTEADCKIEICTSPDVLSSREIKAAFGDRCDAAMGQLTEPWGDLPGRSWTPISVQHSHLQAICFAFDWTCRECPQTSLVIVGKDEVGGRLYAVTRHKE